MATKMTQRTQHRQATTSVSLIDYLMQSCRLHHPSNLQGCQHSVCQWHHPRPTTSHSLQCYLSGERECFEKQDYRSHRI